MATDITPARCFENEDAAGGNTRDAFVRLCLELAPPLKYTNRDDDGVIARDVGG